MTAIEHDLDNGTLDGEEHRVSLCSILVGTRLFGINTSLIREVLGARVVERVPLAPAFIGGLVPYRGDVLTTVSARALLGLPKLAGASCVLILEAGDPEESGSPDSERFGLIVDRVGGVVVVDRRRLASNPSTLDDVGRALFSGAFRVDEGLLVQLDPRRLNPARLAETGLFSGQRATGAPTLNPHDRYADRVPSALETISEEK